MATITTVMETITPEIAKEYLSHNTNRNRKMNMRNVKKYVRDMRTGKFKLTHQGIAFDENGNLIDGQHRLLAICLANVPITMMVCRGLPEDTFTCIDRGYNRTFTECAAISNPGDGVMERAMRDRVMASAVRQIATCTMKAKMAVSTDEILKLYDVFGSQIEAIYDMVPARRSGCSRSQVLSAAIAALYNGVPVDAVEKFFGVFKQADIEGCSGYNVNAAIKWRRKMDNSRQNRGYLDAKKVFYGTQNAIYNFVTGSNVRDVNISEKPRYDVSEVIKPIFAEV